MEHKLRGIAYVDKRKKYVICYKYVTASKFPNKYRLGFMVINK